jgi:hypothetical protein
VFTQWHRFSRALTKLRHPSSLTELSPKVVDGRDRSSGFFDPVDELNSRDHVLGQAAALELPPVALGLLGELEDHRQARLA